MVEQTFNEVATPELINGAILNTEFEGFREDYLCLHALIMKYRPNSFFEIGTNMGTGTNIICNVIYSYNPEAQVYSLDLPTELAHISLQHPISEGKGDNVGIKCARKFTQLRGDSMKFDFSAYPCEGYFVDGEHDRKHVYHESASICPSYPKIVIWHDADIDQVWDAITSLFYGSMYFDVRQYQLYRITDTRIAYALKL